ncbi:MAG: DNA-3-methyladenine glycosylase I [Chlorobiota bacterium]
MAELKKDRLNRCGWCLSSELYMEYHDKEWGKPLYDDRLLFEFLVLESFQSGLSWITILNKRENFRLAYDNFEIETVAKYNDDKLKELMNNSGIIRNSAKIDASINNAKLVKQIQSQHGSFQKYIWEFVGGKPIKNKWGSLSQVPSQTDLSIKMSKQMKKEGFKFLGPTTCYSFMQATGMVNDHLKTCFRYNQV